MAALALVLWPFITMALFAMLGPARGLIWAVSVGYLFLPENYGFDLPGLPPYNKLSAISISLLFGLLVAGRHHDASRLKLSDRRFRTILLSLTGLLFLSALFTVLTNTSSVSIGAVVRPGLSLRDIIAMTSEMIMVLVPFFLGWLWLSEPERHKELLICIVILGTAYTFLALFEIRMSPQLHRWVYGYFQHSWVQHLRGGGFRPIIFLRHGLWLGFFLFMIVIAAFALAKSDDVKNRALFAAIGIWSSLVLLLSYNLGAVILAVLFVPVLLFTGRWTQVRVAMLVALVFLSYPLLRQTKLLPVESFVSVISNISEKRASSFAFRLEHETELLDRALEKPLFGWGGWARSRLFDEKGRYTSVTDGQWTLLLGERGWAGYIAYFGILTLPILFMFRTRRRKPIPATTAGMAVMIAGNLVYLVPNSAMNPIAFLVIGALAGYVQRDPVTSDAPDGAVVPDETGKTPASRGPRYTRFGPGAEDAAPVRRVTASAGQSPKGSRYQSRTHRAVGPDRTRRSS